MINIEVDEEVFKFLQENAIPFVEKDPNAVLRRMLLSRRKEKAMPSESVGSASIAETGETDEFVTSILEKDFPGEKFRKKSGYRMMFESDNYIVYFQNFNKAGVDDLWYRLHESPQDTLRGSSKRTLVYFTNPAERIAYSIPFQDIVERRQESQWRRKSLEVNIDISNHEWHELNWDISKFFKDYSHQ